MALYTLASTHTPPKVALQDAWSALDDQRRPLPLHVEPEDPWHTALAGIWSVMAAEHPERQPSVSWNETVTLIDPTLAAVGFTVDAPGGPLSDFVRAAVPDRGDTKIVPIEPPPDAPLRNLRSADVRTLVASTLDLLEVDRPAVIVTTSEHLTGRPLGGPAAAVAGAATGWARRNRVPVLHVGPWGEGPARLGVRPIDAATLRAGLRTVMAVGRVWAVDADWPAVVSAFPHLRTLAGDQLRPHVLTVVLFEVGRVLKRPEVPIDRPLRDLGLDSLGWEELRARLQERLGVYVPARLMFDHPTVAALAGALDRTRTP